MSRHGLDHDFVYDNDIKVLNKEPRRYHETTPTYFTDPYDKNCFQQHLTIHTEYVYTLQIPESALHRLIETDKRFFQSVDDGRRDTFYRWMSAQQRERELQQSNPAVRDAYEKYCTLLHLCSNEKLDTINL